MEQPETAIKTGLVLSGGGARAAYQVGVLRAIAEILPHHIRQPFPVIAGTSAGAINALGLAGRPGTFRSRTRMLTSMWGSLTSESIYRTHFWGVLRNALDIALSALSSRYARSESLALLDNAPLRELLEDAVRFTHIERAVASGELHAVAVTAMNYSTGLSTTFFQGHPDLTPWERSRRRSVPCVLGVDHLMASSALPTLFPATRIGDEYFGDGALRQSRPLSPAIQLGADRLLIIGVSENTRGFAGANHPDRLPPTIPQVMGQMLNAVFLDAVQADLETLERINGLIGCADPTAVAAAGLDRLRRIETLTISPSLSLAELAREHVAELPRSMRLFLRSTRSIREDRTGGALSYVLFEQGYCQRLIELGYADAQAQAREIEAFFAVDGVDTSEFSDTRASLWQMAGPVVRKPLGPLQRAWYQLIGKPSRRV